MAYNPEKFDPMFKTGISLKADLFCRLYVSKEFFGNGLESYAEAYDKDLKNPSHYNAAKSEASQLLDDPRVLEYINSMIDEAGLNEAFVDKQLLKLITQDSDKGSKVAAIKEFNRMKGRIVEKTDLTSKGAQIDSIVIYKPEKKYDTPKPLEQIHSQAEVPSPAAISPDESIHRPKDEATTWEAPPAEF